MNISNYLKKSYVSKKDISDTVEILDLNEEELCVLLKLISITEKEIYDKKTEIINNEKIKEIDFGNDALKSYNKVSYDILSIYAGIKKELKVHVYELDYLLSAIEIGKDIISETGKEIVPIDVLDSLFVKIYDKYRKYKREIMAYFTLYDEKERVEILKNMYKKRDY